MSKLQKSAEIGARLRVFSERKYPSLKDFAEKLDITPQSLQGYLTGRRTPGVRMQEKLAKLGCDTAWLMTGRDRVVGVPFGNRYYPLVAEIHAGNSGLTQAAFVYESRENISGPDIPSLDGALYFEVRGDSMENKWEDGDLVLAHPNFRPKHGGYGVVCWDDNEAALKKIFYQEGKIILQSINSKYEPITLDPATEQVWFLGSIITTIHKEQRYILSNIKKGKHG